MLLTYDDRRKFFAIARAFLKSPGKADRLRSDLHGTAKWVASFPTEIIPRERAIVRAWVYDPEHNRCVLLEGEAVVEQLPKASA